MGVVAEPGVPVLRRPVRDRGPSGETVMIAKELDLSALAQ